MKKEMLALGCFVLFPGLAYAQGLPFTLTTQHVDKIHCTADGISVSGNVAWSEGDKLSVSQNNYVVVRNVAAETDVTLRLAPVAGDVLVYASKDGLLTLKLPLPRSSEWKQKDGFADKLSSPAKPEIKLACVVSPMMM